MIRVQDSHNAQVRATCNEDKMNVKYLHTLHAIEMSPCLESIETKLPRTISGSTCLGTLVVSSVAYSESGMLDFENDNNSSDSTLHGQSKIAKFTSISHEAKPSGGKIGTWMLVGLIYYAVSGGPLGLEIAIKAGGPLLTLIGFIMTPIVWSCSEVALTTELSIAYPEASGYCAWLNAAFGPYSSFLCSSLHYVSGVLDNALYPVSLEKPYLYMQAKLSLNILT